jgi:hypothetical protein
MNSETLSEQEKIFQFAKLGKLEHLQSIQKGKIRFTDIRCYRHIENNSIGDKLEGSALVHHVVDGDKITFSHPLLFDGKELDITKSIQSFCIQPDMNYYIFCMTHFSNANIIRKEIFSENIYKENDWDHVLFFLNPEAFFKKVDDKIINASPIRGPVDYADYNINQNNLSILSKPIEYRWQKEFRIGFNILLENNFERINNDTVIVDIGDITNQSFILPIKEFCDGFCISYK